MDILKRMHAARSAAVTCSASRHAAQIGAALVLNDGDWRLANAPRECGESIAATVAALWEARAEVARLKSNLAAIEDEKNAYIEYVGDALGQDHDGETLWDAAQRVLSERDRLRSICAAAYQLAGTVGAPQRFLDALSRGDGDVDTLLPISDDEIESLRDAARLRAALELNPCPYTARNHTGNGTVRACIDAGECGCDNADALSEATAS